MEVRKATIDDFEQIKEIKIRVKVSERRFNKLLKPAEKNKKLYFDYLRHDLTNKDKAIFMAVEKDKPIGMITGRIHKTLPIKTIRKKGHISNLFVMPGHRRKGVAGKLVKELLKWFKRNDVKDIRLGVYVKNTSALNMFRKLKFREYAIEMKKSL